MATKYWIGGTTSTTTDWNVAANWSPSGVPSGGDDIFIEANPSGTDYDIDTNLATPASTNFNSFNVAMSYTGNIGTSTSYLQVGQIDTAVNIGYQYDNNSYSGPSLLKLKVVNTAACTFNIENGNTSSAGGYGSIQLVHANAASVLNVSGGYVSVSANPLDVASQFSVITVSGGVLQSGSGVTMTTLNVKGGTVSIQSAATTLNIYGGRITSNGSGAYTTINVYSGATYTCNSTGTITTINVSGTADFSVDAKAKTITNCNVFSGYSLNLFTGKLNSITLTNGIVYNNCGIDDGNLTLNPNQTLSLS